MLPELLVRINFCKSEDMWIKEIEATIAKADGYMLPKVRSLEDMLRVHEVIGDFEAKFGLSEKSKVLVPIATETPMGVLNINEICGAPRVAAAAWGCEDLSEQLGSLTNRDKLTNEYLDVFKHARISTLMAAKAHGIMAIDGAFTNISDTDGL